MPMRIRLNPSHFLTLLAAGPCRYTQSSHEEEYALTGRPWCDIDTGTALLIYTTCQNGTVSLTLVYVYMVNEP